MLNCHLMELDHIICFFVVFELRSSMICNCYLMVYAFSKELIRGDYPGRLFEADYSKETMRGNDSKETIRRDYS